METLIMKWITVLVIFLFSCSRGNDLNTEQPEISFDINGAHYSHSGNQSAANGSVGVFAIKSTGGGNSSYSFSGYQNGGNIVQLNVNTGSDTLKVITYNPAGIVIKAGGDQYIISSGSVAISSYQNGTVSGSFSGSASKVVSPTVLTPVTFSNGIIRNVRINY